MHVKRLRSKIESDPANPIHLVTVRGLGYKLEGSTQRRAAPENLMYDREGDGVWKPRDFFLSR